MEMISTSGVAEKLDYSERSVRRWAENGELQGKKVRGKWQFAESEVERFDKERFIGPALKWSSRGRNYWEMMYYVLQLPHEEQDELICILHKICDAAEQGMVVDKLNKLILDDPGRVWRDIDGMIQECMVH